MMPEISVASSMPSTPWRHAGGDQHDEGSRRAADLEAAAAEQRDEEAADNCSVQPTVGGNTRGDRDGHRQWQGDDGYGQARYGVGPKLDETIAFAECNQALGGEFFYKPGLVRHKLAGGTGDMEKCLLTRAGSKIKLSPPDKATRRRGASAPVSAKRSGAVFAGKPDEITATASRRQVEPVEPEHHAPDQFEIP